MTEINEENQQRMHKLVDTLRDTVQSERVVSKSEVLDILNELDRGIKHGEVDDLVPAAFARKAHEKWHDIKKEENEGAAYPHFSKADWFDEFGHRLCLIILRDAVDEAQPQVMTLENLMNALTGGRK